jgi:3-hydroxybutyryl-CoA dehydrogenase
MNLETILVIGAGTMGAGIAQVTARAGLRTILFDPQAVALERAIQQTRKDLEKLEAKGKISSLERGATLERLRVSETLEDATQAQLVIEAASENLEVKHAIFRKLEAHVSADTIIATNTSTISISAIASVLEHPERALGLHFFNPATVMPLVEVINGDQTSAQTLEVALAFVARIQKTAVIAKDTPGFIVNRIARPYYLEAMRILSEHGESPELLEKTDRIMRGAGFRMGPFELLDLIGLDINLAASKSVYEAFFQDPKYRPSPIQQRMVDAGRLGRKTGRGFYDHLEKPKDKP